MPSVSRGSPRLDLKPTIKRVLWAFPKEGETEIENKETERQKAIAERGETLMESPPMGSTPFGVFIITVYSNTTLIPLL
jgi:hypothetical protein